MPATEVDLYLRLSNADEGADSLERQERDLRAWADREGLTVRKVWSDYGRSGYKRDVQRDGFDAAVNAVTSGEVAVLAVWKLDRLSRRGAGHVGTILDDLEHANGRLVFLMDGLDTRHASARLVIVTISEIARSESANTSLRVRSRKAADRAAGKYLGSAPPLGYQVDEQRHLVPDPVEFRLMRELVHRVTAGESLLAVAREWNTKDIPTRRGGQWRPSTLSNALRSPTLTGLMTHMDKDRTITAYRHPDTGEHVSVLAPGAEAIATQAEQARLLAVMDSRLRAYGRGRRPTKQPRSLLGLLAKCSGCGRSLTTFGDSYRCKRSFNDGTDCPAPVSVSVAVLDDAVRRAWATRLAALEPDDAVLDVIADRWLKKIDPKPLRERTETMKEIDELDERLRQADADYYEHGVLDAARHARVAEGLTARLARLRDRLAGLPQPEADIAVLMDPELSLPLIENATVYEARSLLGLMIQSVTVSPAPRRGARFVAHERLTYSWMDSDR